MEYEVLGDREGFLEHECERLRQENARLRAQLARYETVRERKPVEFSAAASETGIAA